MTTVSRPRMVVANWKMNPLAPSDVKQLLQALTKRLAKSKASIVIAPSLLHLALVRGALSTRYTVSAQDAHPKDGGPHTGSVSARMLYACGARASIVGHSERRAMGETDKDVNEKVRALLSLSMTPIVCVGESSRDQQGKYYSFVESQLRGAFEGVKRSEIERVVIAYEPVWAISSGDGKGKTATPHDAHEMKLFIQKTLVELCGRATAMKVRILYGGSVNEGNAAEIMKDGEVDGFLVGGASLKPDSFAAIVRAVDAA